MPTSPEAPRASETARNCGTPGREDGRRRRWQGTQRRHTLPDLICSPASSLAVKWFKGRESSICELPGEVRYTQIFPEGSQEVTVCLGGSLVKLLFPGQEVKGEVRYFPLENFTKKIIGLSSQLCVNLEMTPSGWLISAQITFSSSFGASPDLAPILFLPTEKGYL